MSKSVKFLQHANSVEELVTDAELDKAWGHANFGGMTKREVLRLGTLKCLAGWHQGHTSKTICTELGLINDKYKITAKGRAYIWLACAKGSDF
jgi:hypothetical protein